MDRKIAISLSGGGFRAALFHLGALRRLNEFGMLPHLGVISAVSGGSILAAHLATVLRPWPSGVVDNWDDVVERPFRMIASKDFRTWPILKRLLPWNWLNENTQAAALEHLLRAKLTPLLLRELPIEPKFIFCATDMQHGVSWIFERARVGSYLSGYRRPSGISLATAVAASSCFPPYFSPMHLGPFRISDGGLYDNLGLEPVKQSEMLLVSDGGSPFDAGQTDSISARWVRYLAVIARQTGALRKRMLLSSFRRREKHGCYWGIGSAAESYRIAGGYSKALAVEAIARIRTDLNAFTSAEADILLNHGYTVANAAVSRHLSTRLVVRAELRIPVPSMMDETIVRAVLRKTAKA